MISPESSTLVAVGETVQLTARVLDQNGWAMTQAAVTWSVSEASVASVDGTGLVTAVANGTANVTAAAGGASGSASVTVRQQAVELLVSPAADTLDAPGDTLRLTAEAYDAGGHGIPGLEFVWSSSSDSIATVDSTGLVTAAGRGLVEIVARAVGDGAGDQAGSATILVNRDRFLSPPQFDPDILPVNTVTPIRVRVAVAPTEGLDVAEVTVVQVDKDGAELDLRIPLYDNGDPSNGDDAAGDGIYSNLHTITPPPATKGLLRFRATARGHLNGEPVRDRSLVATLTVVEPATSEQIDEVLETQASALDRANQVLAATSDTAAALFAAEEFLRAHPAVAAVSRTGSTSINLTYTSGLLGAVVFTYLDENGKTTTRGGGLASHTDSAGRRRPPPSDVRPVVAAGASARADFATDPDTTLILSNKVLLFEPFEFSHNEGDSIKSLVEERLGLEVRRFRSSAATIEVLKEMTGYGLVVLATHGSAGDWIATRTRVTDAIRELAHNDQRYRILTLPEGIEAVGVTSKFVKQLDGRFPQSVIINNSCESTKTGRLWNEFRSKGAKTYYGYHRVVSSQFAVERAIEVVDALTQYKTTGEAFRSEQKDPYLYEEEEKQAEFQIRGKPEMRFGGDREALVALYKATDGDNWKRNDNWLSDLPIEDWIGVSTRTDSTGMRVERLRLARNELTGEIPPQLGRLSQLRELWLWGNELTGDIPGELGKLSKLEVLVLDANELTGEIPSELGQLPQLLRLSLDDNRLTGSIPPELGQLSTLRGLELTLNELTGEIPRELGQLSLHQLKLAFNELTGEMPRELGQFPPHPILGPGALGVDLRYNRLTGCIPPRRPGFWDFQVNPQGGWNAEDKREEGERYHLHAC